MIFLRHDCYGGFKRAMTEERRWRTEPIIHLHEDSGHFTVPGEMVYYSYPVDMPVARMMTVGEIEYDSVTFNNCAAQKFTTIWYKRSRRDYFNRRSGRYMHSETVCHHRGGETHHSWSVIDGIKLSDVELKEEQR